VVVPIVGSHIAKQVAILFILTITPMLVVCLGGTTYRSVSFKNLKRKNYEIKE
jgi:hypothetical protein